MRVILEAKSYFTEICRHLGLMNFDLLLLNIVHLSSNTNVYNDLRFTKRRC